jgi:kynurenine formamidase
MDSKMALSGITVVCILMLNVFLTQSEWIDMSHAYRENMNGATDPLEISLAHYGATGRAPFAISYKMRLSEHSGTHIDAPVHFSKGKPTVDELLPENLIGHAIVINITEQALKNPDYEVSVDDFTNWEKEHGAIPKGTIVFLLTGRGKYWGNVMKYMGLVGNISGDYHFPGNVL